MCRYLALFLIALSNLAFASNPNAMYAVTGKCLRTVIFGNPMNAASCSNKLINSEWQNDRIGFVFMLQGDKDDTVVVYTFIGNGPEQVHKNNDHVVQPIHRVNLTFNGETSSHKAVGSCEFENPFIGMPAKVSCSVDTDEGKFIGEFVSDGNEPKSIQ